MADRKTLYVIDGHAQIFRAYHAIRGGMSSPVTGEPTNATFGFVGMLLKVFREYQPDYLAIVIDVSGDTRTFRSELDPQYKATRDAPPEDLAPQTDRIVQIASLMGIPVLGVEGVEADDVIASIVAQLEHRDDLDIRLVSKDKDLQQLLAEHVAMVDVHKDTTIDLDALQEDRGIRPQQVVDVLALMGDNIDNIPGVKNVGPKTAAKWIAQYGSIEALLEHIDELTTKQQENLEAAKDRLELNRQLVTLRRDVGLDFDLETAAVKPLDIAALEPVFKQLGFTRHLEDARQLAGAEPSAQGDQASGVIADSLFGDVTTEAPAAPANLTRADATDYRAITTRGDLDTLIDRVLAAVDAGGVVSVDTETDSLAPMQAKLCGVSIAYTQRQDHEQTAERGAYIPIRCQDAPCLDEKMVLETLRPVLEDPAVPKVGQNLKYDMLVLRRHGVELRGATFDTMVASYLIDATRSSHKLDNLALAHLGHEMIPIEQVIGKGKQQRSFDCVPLDEATVYAAEDADVALRLCEFFTPQLKTMGLKKLFDELEMPLVYVLAELEYNGIRVDPDELDRQREAMAERITELRRQIIDTAGVDFNPDSPKQLSAVLFDEMGCRAYRRTKSGPSTDSEVLQRIVDEQAGPGAEVAERVLEYRQLTKLTGTYLQALRDAIDPDTGRVHASFNQTVTATGRLSSSDPNLQNIPIRTDLGRQVRKAFVAPAGHVLLGADYSQIELRVLAHLSQDAGLVEAFEADRDIHRAVAAEVFEIEPDDVDARQRHAAKMVNFGIIYGITPWGLARRLAAGVGEPDVERARQIISRYKARYPKIDRFLARCIEQAQTKGYVETVMSRRRAIPQIRSRRANLRALGERMAINTVVQGSAADLIKVAMVKLHRRIDEQALPLKMLLQIHDELVVECPADQVEAMRDVVIEEMTGAMDLRVPLKVEVSWAEDWFAAK